MLRLMTIGVLLLFATAQVAEARRTHVTVHKNYPRFQKVPPQALGAVAFIVAPIGIAYDLERRINCVGDPLGLGGPGFDRPVTPADGNVMIPACQRFYYKPRRY